MTDERENTGPYATLRPAAREQLKAIDTHVTQIRTALKIAAGVVAIFGLATVGGAISVLQATVEHGARIEALDARLSSHIATTSPAIDSISELRTEIRTTRAETNARLDAVDQRLEALPDTVAARLEGRRRR